LFNHGTRQVIGKFLAFQDIDFIDEGSKLVGSSLCMSPIKGVDGRLQLSDQAILGASGQLECFNAMTYYTLSVKGSVRLTEPVIGRQQRLLWVRLHNVGRCRVRVSERPIGWGAVLRHNTAYSV